MASYDKNPYQELNHGCREFCRESGPLRIGASNTSFPKALGLVSSVVTTAAAALMIIILVFSRPVNVGSTTAELEVEIRNRPEASRISYDLAKLADLDTVLETGFLESDQQMLRFVDLDRNTEYVVTYYSETASQRDELTSVTFRTSGQEEPADPNPPVSEKATTESTEVTTAHTTEETTVAATEETTEETTAVTTEETTEETTVETNPPAPKPKPKPKPSQPNPTQSTDAPDPSAPINTVPTDPVDPSEPINTVPTDPVDPSEPISTVPTDPVNPSEPISTVPTDPVDPSEPINTVPTDPVDPSEAPIVTQPAYPTGPIETIATTPSDPTTAYADAVYSAGITLQPTFVWLLTRIRSWF